MMMTAFWDVALCGLVEFDRSFRGPYWLHHQHDRPVNKDAIGRTCGISWYKQELNAQLWSEESRAKTLFGAFRVDGK
jgi:hypothetical protein